jgi:hypothetical protein
MTGSPHRPMGWMLPLVATAMVAAAPSPLASAVQPILCTSAPTSAGADQQPATFVSVASRLSWTPGLIREELDPDQLGYGSPARATDVLDWQRTVPASAAHRPGAPSRASIAIYRVAPNKSPPRTRVPARQG